MDELLSETKPPNAQEIPGSHEISGTPIIPGAKEVLAICKLLEDHRGGDIIALDLRELHLWTDFFIIATVSSGTHLQGLLRHIKDFAGSEGLSVKRRTERAENGGWNLIDMGTVVIHLMTAPFRDFYELEKLWSSALQIYPAKDRT